MILDYLNTINTPVSGNKISTSIDKGETVIKATLEKLIEKDFVKLDTEASRKLKKDI